VTDRDEPVTKGTKPAGSYPRKVQEDTRRLVDELVSENERMHALIADLNRELFDLLAVHAAMALYCTSLHARLGTASPR